MHMHMHMHMISTSHHTYTCREPDEHIPEQIRHDFDTATTTEQVQEQQQQQQQEGQQEEQEGLTNHKLYERLFDQKLASSNLGNDAGVGFVFSGVPPEGSPDVIGYMLRDHDIMVTFTTRRPSAAEDGIARWQACLTSALSWVRELLSS